MPGQLTKLQALVLSLKLGGTVALGAQPRLQVSHVEFCLREILQR